MMAGSRYSSSDWSSRARTTRTTVVACLFILLIGYLFSCVPKIDGAERRRPVTRTRPRWFPVSTPEEQGMDTGHLAQAVDHFIESRELNNIHSVTFVRNRHVVADTCFHHFEPGLPHERASTSRVVTTTLVGIAVAKGFIAGIHERVIDFFPDRSVASTNTWTRELTIEHLLTMTSGLGFDDTADTREMQESDDRVQYALGLYEVFRLTADFSNHGDDLTVTVEDLDRFDPDPIWTMTGMTSREGGAKWIPNREQNR